MRILPAILYLFIALIAMPSCNQKKAEPIEEEGEQSQTRIIVGKGNDIFAIDDFRAIGQDYSTPNEMTIAYQKNLGGPVSTTASVYAGRVFMGSADGSFHVFYLDDGAYLSDGFEDLYPVQVTEEIKSSVISVSGADNSAIGLYYLLGATGEIRRLTDYEVDVSIDLETSFHSTPAYLPTQAYSPRLVFGAEDGLIRAIDVEDGSSIWSVETGGPIHGNPLRFNTIPGNGAFDVIVGSDDGKLYWLRGIDGSTVLEFQAGGAIRSSPELNHWTDPISSTPHEDPLFFFGCDDGKVYALSAATGQLRWSFQTEGPIRSSPHFQFSGPAFAQVGMVVVGSDDGNVYSLDSQTGELLWARDMLSGPIVSSPIGIQNVVGETEISPFTIYVSTETGVYGLDAGTGDIRSQIVLPGLAISSPVVAQKYAGFNPSPVSDLWQGAWHPAVTSDWFW